YIQMLFGGKVVVSDLGKNKLCYRLRFTGRDNQKKEEYFSYIEKQKRNFEGQKNMLNELENNPFIDIKPTPLKQKEGKVSQKGVDVLLATDLVHLAHTGAYDIAIILSGDTDLIEAVRLIKTLGKTPIIFSYHTPGNPELSNISDLMNAGKFINLKNFAKKEIFEMSDLRKEKGKD
ncbi:MAG: NYN domain-containing protein, partial [Nanoarchaeota archaeon]|nr:NYN domain-containing protein [Nanoarchaeota archaeon]